MDDMADARFNLVYDGPALREHRMDVRELAPALMAMGDLIERANELLNGQQTRVSVNVHASFKSGSFGIDLELAQSLWQRMLEIAGSTNVTNIKSIVELLGLVTGAYVGGKKGYQGLVAVVRWLRGRQVQRIEPVGDGLVRLWIEDDHIETEEKVLRLLEDYKIRKDLESLIYKPLKSAGIDTFATVDKKADLVYEIVRDSDAHYFVAPPPVEQVLQRDEYVSNLQILNLAFKDENKWRFTDGGGAFYATVSDRDFLDRVAANQEQFSKDDLIRARVSRTQRVEAAGLTSDYEILEVLEHRSASPKVQLKLNIPDSSDSS